MPNAVLGLPISLESVDANFAIRGRDIGMEDLSNEVAFGVYVRVMEAMGCGKQMKLVTEDVRSNSRGRLATGFGVRGGMRMNIILGSV